MGHQPRAAPGRRVVVVRTLAGVASGRFSVVRLDEVERVRATEGPAWWRPLRRVLGVTAFGINAYTADRECEELIERHDETSAGAGGHEEVYVVLSGRAAFEVDGEAVDAPAGTVLRVDRGAPRAAVAAAPDTTVLVIGGVPGAALPVSPYEHWYAAQPAYLAGDYARAVEIASAGLADWPDHPLLHYQLACFHALGGDREAATGHLRRAFDGDPRTRAWAAEDDDLVSVRDDPALAREDSPGARDD
jgi:hypothetical protein